MSVGEHHARLILGRSYTETLLLTVNQQLLVHPEYLPVAARIVYRMVKSILLSTPGAEKDFRDLVEKVFKEQYPDVAFQVGDREPWEAVEAAVRDNLYKIVKHRSVADMPVEEKEKVVEDITADIIMQACEALLRKLGKIS